MCGLEGSSRKKGVSSMLLLERAELDAERVVVEIRALVAIEREGWERRGAMERRDVLWKREVILEDGLRHETAILKNIFQ